MKRVYCLYRVSTLGQVEKDDIPMQKQSCHEFVAGKADWKITGEFLEKGISGFKVSAKDRDAIQDLQKAAAEKQFDILLVFMFDRLGRREDETPFVVEWFVQHGIEVWSVNEGQQRFDNHVDKLLNYIRFWQASGESVKTSIRTKTRMGQIVQEGRFKGGVAPFGYRLVHQGRMNKKGNEVYDLEVDPIEASIVRLIFDRHVNAGIGPQAIATFLTAKGVSNRAGRNFTAPSIRNILANEAYRGVLRCGDISSKAFDHLRIIDDEVFSRSKELARQRSTKCQEQRRLPRKIAKNCLLTGNIFCGHCGARLITSTAGSTKKRKDGSLYTRRYWRYRCYNDMRHKGVCDGQTGYTAQRIDEAVTAVVLGMLDTFKKVPVSVIVEKRCGIETEHHRSEFVAAENNLKKKTSELDALKREIVKTISGSSSFRPDLLNEAIEIAEAERALAEQTVEKAKRNLSATKEMIASLHEQHEQLFGWAEMFKSCDLNERRMIICQLIDRIEVSRDYILKIELNVTMRQYLELSDVNGPASGLLSGRLIA